MDPAALGSVRARIEAKLRQAIGLDVVGVTLALASFAPVGGAARVALLVVSGLVMASGVGLSVRWRAISTIVRDGEWRAARMLVVPGGPSRYTGLKTVIVLNDDLDHPDLAMVSGTWRPADCIRAATEGLLVTGSGDRLVAASPSGDMVHTCARPKPSKRWLAEARLSAARG
jgi:hypothetical protein